MDASNPGGGCVELGEWEVYLGFRDRIAPILDQRLYPIAWLDAQVFVGNARVFWEGDSCLLVELKTFPSGARECHAMLAVGDAEQVAKVLAPRAEQFGRDCGCIIASVASRPGWAKVLKDYTPYQLTLRKEL